MHGIIQTGGSLKATFWFTIEADIDGNTEADLEESASTLHQELSSIQHIASNKISLYNLNPSIELFHFGGKEDVKHSGKMS